MTALRPACAFLLVAVLAPLSRAQSVQREAARDPAGEVRATLDAVVAQARRVDWPEFVPGRTPIAIFAAGRTYLYRHPSPPAEYRADASGPSLWVREGRDPLVTANSSVELGGTLTATVLMDLVAGSRAQRAATAIHETFHVLQRRRAVWPAANEVALFTYPADSASLLALRWEEGEALRRALRATDATARGCWARTALSARTARFAVMPDDAARYERDLERQEGLADYVETRSIALSDSIVMPDTRSAPDAIRDRAYAAGNAWARLLDHSGASWKLAIDTLALDEALARTLAPSSGRATTSPACALETSERALLAREAVLAVGALAARRAVLRARVTDETMWRIEVVASRAPLFPQGFDPLNVQLVAPGEVVHSRWVKLGNALATVEALGRPALTESAGTHPLFNGVTRVTIGGLPTEPTVRNEAGQTVIEGEGVTLRVRAASVERVARRVVITLADAAPSP